MPGGSARTASRPAEARRSPAALEMDNEIHRLQFLEKRLTKGIRLGPDDIRRLSRLASWRELRTNFDDLFARNCDLENQALLGLLGHETLDGQALQRGLQSVRVAWDQNLLKLYLQRFDKPDDVIVTIFSEYPTFLLMLAEAYCRIVLATHSKAEVWQFLPGSA